MNWRRYFTSTILERGKKYQKDGFVNNLKKVGDTYSAVVYGTNRYRVSITINNGKVKSMRCNCPYAAEGKTCKHMAAVCMEIDEFFYEDIENKQLSMEEELDPIVKPFALKNTAESKVYTYFDLSVMTEKIAIKKSMLEHAKKLVENKEVVLNNVRIGYLYGAGDKDEMAGNLMAYHLKDGFSAPITIQFTTSKITQVNCMARRCGHSYYGYSYYGKSELCVHALAALLLLEKYIEENNPGDSTNSEAKTLISLYHSKHKSEFIEKEIEVEEDVSFEPRLEEGWENLLLSFRVGTRKLYVAKNLTELIENIESGNEQLFGKNTEIDFGMHKVSTESKKIYEFVRKVVKEERQRVELMQHSTRYYEDELIKDTIPLFGRRIDEFFEILYAGGKGVEYQNKYTAKKKTILYMREKEHQLKLCIKGDYDSRNILKGIIVSGKTPQFFKGESSFYYVEDGYLNRISQPCAEVLGPIIEMSPYKRVRLEFGRKAFADFYHHVMPMLSEYVEFEDMEPDILDTYVPPKAEFKFYLDAETDVITCDTKVIYGEDEISIYKLIEEDTMPEELRDMSAEAEVCYHMHRYFPYVDEDRGLFIGERDEESVFAVLERGVNELLTLGEVFCTDRLKRITIRKKTPLSVGVSLESGIMNLDISSEEYSNEELLEILGSYRKRKKYHQLKNGDYLNLEDENIQMLEEMMESLHISSKEFLKGNIKVPAYRALYLDKVLEKK